tara:strand:- start:2123 stop:3022 length:900 start_codon:yes stop_codon:yes gene_type:complete
MIVLQKLIDSSHNILATVTQDIKKGKRNKEKKTPVGVFSELNSIDTYYPEDLSSPTFLDKLKSYNPDFIVVFSYGKILPCQILEIPKIGSLNIHCSLLPKWRGASPIQRAIENDDQMTGLSFFLMSEELDKGNLIATHEMIINDFHNTKTLQIELANIAGNMIVDIISNFTSDVSSISQNDSKATYANKIMKSEARISWNNKCRDIFCKVRAFIEWPVVETTILDEIVKIYDVTYKICNDSHNIGDVINLTNDYLSIKALDGIIFIRKLQLPGGKPITPRDLKNSNSTFSKNIKQISEK